LTNTATLQASIKDKADKIVAKEAHKLCAELKHGIALTKRTQQASIKDKADKIVAKEARKRRRDLKKKEKEQHAELKRRKEEAIKRRQQVFFFFSVWVCEWQCPYWLRCVYGRKKDEKRCILVAGACGYKSS
jgi:hypothetical protein